MTLAFPLVVLPTRFTVETVLSRYETTEPRRFQARLVWRRLRVRYKYPLESSPARRVLLTAVICAAAASCAVAVPAINIVFQLMGGTAASFVCYVCPPYFYLSMASERGMPLRDWKGICAAVLAVVGALVGAVSTAFTVVGIVVGKSTTQYCPSS